MKPRLLIAESDEQLADDYGHFFWKFGLDVVTAHHGLACLDILRRRPPHALILEHELPWGGGDGVVARMREDIRLASVPVVMTMGDRLEDQPPSDEFEPPFALPVVTCFRKPFRMTALWETLRAEIPELATERFFAQAECLLAGSGGVRRRNGKSHHAWQCGLLRKRS